MSLPLAPLVALYQTLLAPIPILAAYGMPVGILDILGTLRLALAVQQIKFGLRLKEAKTKEVKEKGAADADAGKILPEASAVGTGDGDAALKDIFNMLVIVYGGEFLVSSMISQPPSFFTSPVGPLLLTAGHYAVQSVRSYAPNLLPMQPSLKWELPLSILDALTRSVLLCSIGPPTIFGHRSPSISDSATALCITSSVLANGGFFFIHTFNMLSPSGWSIQTPLELQPWGWTSLDFLCAPAISALYATLTQAQTAWRQAGSYLVDQVDVGDEKGRFVGMEDEQARALCALILASLFAGRSVKNFGGMKALQGLFATSGAKIKVQ